MTTDENSAGGCDHLSAARVIQAGTGKAGRCTRVWNAAGKYESSRPAKEEF